jgi:hypothetical protein
VAPCIITNTIGGKTAFRQRSPTRMFVYTTRYGLSREKHYHMMGYPSTLCDGMSNDLTSSQFSFKLKWLRTICDSHRETVMCFLAQQLLA